MKGHATIELTNVKTGEIKVIEEDNIVTDYLPKLLTPHYPFSCTWLDSTDFGVTGHVPTDRNPWITPFHDFGGLIIFKEKLEENAANYRPTGTMVAHACLDTYTGTDLTRGSFNNNLSSYKISYFSDATEPSYVKLVWDFGLEQGNGTIGTVCLCNHNDGKIGLGHDYAVASNFDERTLFMHHCQQQYENQFNAYIYENFDPKITEQGLEYEFGSNNNVGATSNSKGPKINPIFYDSENGRLVCIDYGIIYGDAIRFVIIDTNSNSIQPLNKRKSQDYGSSASDDVSYGTLNKLYKCETYYAPLTVSDTFYYDESHINKNYGKQLGNYQIISGMDSIGNYWYLKNAGFVNVDGMLGTSDWRNNKYRNPWKWASGTTQTLVKLDLRTMQTTEYTITNTTGVDMVVFGESRFSSLVAGITVHKNYLIFRNSDGRLYRINIDNNSDVKYATWLDDETPLVVTAPPVWNPTRAVVIPFVGDASPMNSMYTRILGDYMYFTDKSPLDRRYDDTTQLLVLNLDTFIAKYTSCAGRNEITCYPTYGTQTITGYNNNNVYPFCVSDCEDIPVIDPKYYYTSLVWSADQKSIWHNLQFRKFFQPMGMITINALDKPVVKTSDMTMRITYTVTE